MKSREEQLAECRRLIDRTLKDIDLWSRHLALSQGHLSRLRQHEAALTDPAIPDAAFEPGWHPEE